MATDDHVGIVTGTSVIVDTVEYKNVIPAHPPLVTPTLRAAKAGYRGGAKERRVISRIPTLRDDERGEGIHPH